MATDRANDPHAFRNFLDQQLASDSAPTLDEVLSRWEYENADEAIREETLEAIREGLSDIEAGRVVPAREAISEIRRKHGLPERP